MNNTRKNINVSQSLDNLNKEMTQDFIPEKQPNFMNNQLSLMNIKEVQDNSIQLNKELVSTIIFGPKNTQILEKNNQKTKRDFIHSIRRFDDRTISYDKAKSKLWGLTSNYLSTHFKKEDNSRAVVFP